MSTYSKFLALVAGSSSTRDLGLGSGNALGVADLQLLGSTSGTLDMIAAATTTPYTLVWPAAQGTANQVLAQSGTPGTLTWTTLTSGITQLTGDVTAGPGSGSQVASLATVNSNVGSFGSSTAISSFTVNAKGLITAASTNVVVAPAGTLSGTTLNSTVVSSSLTSVGTISSGTWNGSAIGPTYGGTGLTSYVTGDILYASASNTLSALPIGTDTYVLTVMSGMPSWQPASGGSAITALTGDVTASGPGSAASTLATVNSNVGSFGSASSVPSFTVNAKGLITAASATSVVAPAGTLSGTTLNSTVVTSSLTSLGIQSSALNMGTNQINNLSSPSLSTDAATKGYVDSAISGLTWQGPAQAYANSNVPLTGGATLTIDGYSVQNGDLVLLANQTIASQNGEYSVSGIGSAYALTANGLPTVIGDAWLVTHGTVFSNSAFVSTAIVPAATFIEFAGPTAYVFSSPLLLTGNTVSITQANTSTNGYLSSTDWNTFNNKQPAGSYITALTGDATASGPGSAALTLATVNSNVGSFAIASVTVNAKGLVTAASAASTTGSGSVVLATSPSLTTPNIGAASGISLSLSGLTASEAVFTDGSNNLVSNAVTGTGNVVMSASPTLTGTIVAANATLSGNLIAPVLQFTAVAGQSFVANTSYAVRWGLTANSETSTRVYAADDTTSSFNLYYVIGMASSGTSVSAGQNITVTTLGSFTLSSGDTAFGANTDGEPVFLTTAGGFSTTSPSASGTAVTRIGIIETRSATNTSNVIWVAPQTIGIN